jgi:DNA-binding HxlR family transcriptional regulator
LIALGLAQPNPGYGHPLRPEYLVAARGAGVAEACAAVWEAARRVGATEVAFQKWTLPIVLALAERTLRYGELGAALAPITPRALALALRRAERTGLVERAAAGGFPPATYYRLTEGSLGLVGPLGELVGAWGELTEVEAG